MNKDKKLRTAFLLIVSSILLLVLLQGYWLRNAWLNEYVRLKREVSVILRETIIREEIRQIMRNNVSFNVDLVRNDSSGGRNIRDRDSFLFDQEKPDSGKRHEERRDVIIRRGSDTIVFRNGRPDSGDIQMPRRVGFDQEKALEEVGDPGQLVVEWFLPIRDSNLDTLKDHFTDDLLESGINLSYTLEKVPFDTSSPYIRANLGGLRVWAGRGGDRRDNFKISNPKMARATFESPFFYILKKIQWQVFFALAMILVTTTALVFLYRNLRQQQRLSELRSDFIANVTHELKTPIATVGVAIEALKNFDAIHDAARTREYLDISGNEVQRLSLLVDKVLKLSMLGQKQIELQNEAVDVKALIEEVISSMKLQFERQGAKVSLQTEGSNFYVQGDKTHLLSVFYNLLDNALKYAPVDPVITVSLTQANQSILVQVKDNGIGIPDFHQQKIFDKFYRVPHGNTHNIKGYGLGLSYVNEVVHAHGGNIDVESKEGEGSTFTVSLKKAA